MQAGKPLIIIQGVREGGQHGVAAKHVQQTADQEPHTFGYSRGVRLPVKMSVLIARAGFRRMPNSPNCFFFFGEGVYIQQERKRTSEHHPRGKGGGAPPPSSNGPCGPPAVPGSVACSMAGPLLAARVSSARCRFRV
jgi:hypothetical protein